MTTRTVKMFGLAYGSNPAEIAVTLDGVSVYTGTITTTDAPLPSLPELEIANSTVDFCSFEIPMDSSGILPMTCEVLSGTVIFDQIKANYCTIADTDPVIGSGPDLYKSIDGTVDARTNVSIDGVAQSVNQADEFSGSWWFVVPAGSTLTCDLNVVAGTANVAP
jgi:hypothetical protein